MAKKEKKNEIKVRNAELSLLAGDLSKLLDEKLKLILKFNVYELLDDINHAVGLYDKVKLKFFKEHGKDVGDGKLELPKDLDVELVKELNELYNKEIHFDSNLSIDVIGDIESEYPYIWLFKVLNKK